MTDNGAPERRLWRELLRGRATHRWGNFSWISLNALLLSANDAIAKRDATIVNTRRMRWVAAQRDRGIDPESPIWLENAAKLVAVGDPGEMDGSQYVLVRDLAASGADVVLLMSDIVYPAGNIDAWRDAVYLPYFGLPAAVWLEANYQAKTNARIPPWKVFATPGNHDWYDGLTGFMYHACGAEPLPNVTFNSKGLTPVQRLTRRMWQEPARPDRAMVEPLRAAAAARWDPAKGCGPMPRQPGPYFALGIGRAGPDAAVLIVTVDTGVDGSIDVEQAQWLQRVLRGPVPKIVVTGKPLVTGDAVHDLPVRRALPRAGREEPQDVPASVRQLIVEGEHVVATLAGDIHNSQRIVFAGAVLGDGQQPKRLRVTEQTLKLANKAMLPPVQIVAGGGGAYLSETHTTPYGADDGLRLAGTEMPLGELGAERHTRYPDREQSAALFGGRAGPWAGIVLIVVGVLILAAAIAIAVLDESGSSVCVAGSCVPELVAVSAPFALLATIISAALLVAACRMRRWTRALVLLGLTAAAAGLFAWGWNRELEYAPVLLGALGFALAAPLLPLLIPLLQFFPALARLVPLRTIAVALGGLVIQQRAKVDLDNIAVLIVVLAGLVAAVLVLTAWVIPRLLRWVDNLAMQRKFAPLRAFFAVLSLWPMGLIIAAILLLPDTEEWDHAQQAAGMIVLIELLLALCWLCYKAAQIIMATRRLAPGAALWSTAAAGLLCGVAAAAITWLAAGEWWQVLGLGGAGAIFGATVTIGAVLAASVKPAGRDLITAALRARDGHGPAPGPSRHLFRLMTVAAVPGISEIAEATEPPFRKSYLEITYATAGERTTEIRFTAFGLDDEREDDAQDETPPRQERPRGAYVVDELVLELALAGGSHAGTGV